MATGNGSRPAMPVRLNSILAMRKTMNSSLIMLEISVIGLGLVLMLADLFVPAERRRFIGYAAIAALGVAAGHELERQW
jgi:hypothetical protein